MQAILLQILSVDPTHNAHIARHGHLLLDYQRYRSLSFHHASVFTIISY